MEFKHFSVSNFYEKELMLLIKIGLLISKNKKYGISCIRARLEDIEKEKIGWQVKKPA